MKYVFRILILHIIIMFAAAILMSFIWQIPTLPGEVPDSYRFVRGVLWFFAILPAVLIAAYTIGFSLGFGRTGAEKIPRFSSPVFKQFQSAVIVALICTFFAMAAAEFISPLIQQWQTRSVLRSKYYDEYLDLARNYITQKQYELAILYAQNAQSLFPDSEDAMWIQEYAEVVLASVTEQLSRQPQTSAVTQGLPMDSEYSKDELVQRATEAFVAGNWFDAHYFAELAIPVTRFVDDAEEHEMRRISAEAWSKLSIPEELADDIARTLYLTKRDGYSALLSGDAVTAYYIFHDLIATNPRDSDVERYVSLAEQTLLNSYFFLDEVTDLPYFETTNNVCFSLARPDGGRDIVAIRGITELQNSGGLVQYFRLFQISSYDKNGTLLQSIHSPYAKLLRVQGDRPFVILEGIDRDKKGVRFVPEWAHPADGVNTNTLFLNLPYEDLLQIIAASSGGETMSILSLYDFIPKAALYGFSSEVFLQTLMSRLCYPFILIILFLIFAILAWNYRIEKMQAFNLTWIFILPVLTGVILFILQGTVYLEKLLDYSLIGLFPAYAPAVFIAVLAFMIFVLSFRFLALHGD